jgi:hypothetical protein
VEKWNFMKFEKKKKTEYQEFLRISQSKTGISRNFRSKNGISGISKNF